MNEYAIMHLKIMLPIENSQKGFLKKLPEIVVIFTNLTLQGQNLNVSSIFLNYFNNLIFIRFVFYIPAYGQ